MTKVLTGMNIVNSLGSCRSAEFTCLHLKISLIFKTVTYFIYCRLRDTISNIAKAIVQ